MKLIVYTILLFSPLLHAHETTCSGFFNPYIPSPKVADLETHTQNGKPRYYSVRNYSHFKGGELDQYLKSIKNLTQFSEKLGEVSTFVPDRSTIPSEAFFVANKIIPLIEDFLNAHDIKYKIETYERSLTRSKRSLIIISEEGNNPLNEIAKDLYTHGKIALAIDPIELFYGYDHYQSSQGKFFDIDAFTPSYSMSFSLLLHSQRKDFKFSSLARNDLELYESRIENQIESMKNAHPDSLESRAEQEAEQEKFRESRERSAAIINKMIEEARNKKGSSN